ncbi:hypothetical protein Tco_0453482, partial [Tanacetum coccineum]
MCSNRDTNRILEKLLRTLKTNSLVGEPEGSDDYTEVPFDDEQILRKHNTAHVTPSPLAYTPPPPVLAIMEPLNTFLMGDEVISTIPERENDKFIKSSDDELVPIPKESELTLDSTDLECSMPIDPPLPCTDVLGDAIVDIDLLLGEHLDTLSTGDREIDFNPIRDIEELERLLADDPVPVPIPRVFDEPLGHSDSMSRSFNVTFLNLLFDFNDDSTLCYDNPLLMRSLRTLDQQLIEFKCKARLKGGFISTLKLRCSLLFITVGYQVQIIRQKISFKALLKLKRDMAVKYAPLVLLRFVFDRVFASAQRNSSKVGHGLLIATVIAGEEYLGSNGLDREDNRGYCFIAEFAVSER